MKSLNAASLCLFVATGLMIAAPINVALQGNGGVASSSSVYSGNHGAERGNDGNTNQNYYNSPYIVHTNADTNAWWQVNFNNTYLIDDITIYWRNDCCVGRNDGFNLRFYDSSNNVIHSLLNQNTGTGEIASFTDLNINAAALRIELNRAEYLHLGEAIVMADASRTAVPEPATVTLLGMAGLAGLAWNRLHRSPR